MVLPCLFFQFQMECRYDLRFADPIVSVYTAAIEYLKQGF